MEDGGFDAPGVALAEAIGTSKYIHGKLPERLKSGLDVDDVIHMQKRKGTKPCHMSTWYITGEPQMVKQIDERIQYIAGKDFPLLDLKATVEADPKMVLRNAPFSTLKKMVEVEVRKHRANGL